MKFKISYISYIEAKTSPSHWRVETKSKQIRTISVQLFYRRPNTMHFLCTSIRFSRWLLWSWNKFQIFLFDATVVIIKLISKPIISSVTHSSIFHPPVFCASCKHTLPDAKTGSGFSLFFRLMFAEMFSSQKLKQREKNVFRQLSFRDNQIKALFFSPANQLTACIFCKCAVYDITSVWAQQCRIVFDWKLWAYQWTIRKATGTDRESPPVLKWNRP